MRKNIFVTAFIVMIGLPFTSIAENQAIDQCIEAIKNTKKGNFIKLEYLNIKGKSIYELEIADENGFEWEFMCDTETGKIIETESEVSSPNAMAFKERSKVTQEDALNIALKAYPGKVKEVEYEIEENGDPTYEIDILRKDGVETKVEVNAITGKIIEVSVEGWEIGVEEDENR